ncbi:hypothetical protein V8B55DRAFT_1578572 [Mucor lusitanicus]
MTNDFLRIYKYIVKKQILPFDKLHGSKRTYFFDNQEQTRFYNTLLLPALKKALPEASHVRYPPSFKLLKANNANRRFFNSEVKTFNKVIQRMRRIIANNNSLSAFEGFYFVTVNFGSKKAIETFDDCKLIAATTLDLEKLHEPCQTPIDIGFDILCKASVEPTFAVFNDNSASIPYPIGLCSVSGNFNLKPKKTVTRGHINKILGYNIGLWSQFDSNNAEEFLARDLSKSSKRSRRQLIVDDDTETYESIVERFK